MMPEYISNHRPQFGRLFAGILLVLIFSACTSSDNSQSTTGGTTGGQVDGPLGPLPNPPLTAAPSQDDEPIAEPASFNTSTDLQLVRNPVPRSEAPATNRYTDADFESGPLPADITIPDDVNPEFNSAPDFENIQNIEAVAGQQLEIVFKPIDADGELPGMFPVALAPGASFDDNFDGSKTYRWQPLQNDIGINAFAVTAVDSQNSLYRNTRTILIRVRLPDDETQIPNVPPTLDPIGPHTARVNDPVVYEFKGIDLNGTVPTLELLSSLPNASFSNHPLYEDIYTLRFIPTSTGEMNVQVLVRDSVDSNLTTTENVTINVLPIQAFERTGQRLRDLAAVRGIQFGYASLQEYYHRPDGGVYADIAADEFDLVTPENAMKMNEINPSAGQYQFADIDNLVAFARLNNMQVHGHPVIWHRQLPEWIETANAAELEGHMREYIHRLMNRYRDDIALWDVVNEPIGDSGGYRDSLWYNALGETYLETAFHQASTTAPNATLLLNDFDIAINGPKATTLFTMLNNLLERGVPIDGVGFQLHVFSDFNQIDEVRANFQKVADLDLDIYITELDVGLRETDDLQAQANVYASLISVCLQQPRCKAIQTWGFTDQYSFRENVHPLMFDTAYQTKPAYQAIQNALGN